MVVRRDLPLGLMGAMIVHAAGESVVEPLGDATHAIVLMARDELHLALEAERLEARGVPLVRIHEPDSPWHNALMAIGIRPRPKSVLKPLLRHLKVLA